MPPPAAAMDAEQREALILQHLPQVRLIARRILARMPGAVQVEDLISAGVLGLISAVDHFDPAQHTQLKTYAEYRIRGAILDGLRGGDFASRKARRKAKDIEKAIARLEKTLARAPAEDEIAAELGLGLEEYHGWLLDVQSVTLEQFDAPRYGDEEETSMAHTLAGSGEEIPSRVFHRAEVHRLLSEAVKQLPEREQQVLTLYFLHEVTPGEIAQIMNLRLSRVSQLKAQGLLRLRTALRGKIDAIY
jgi:RNA polymerase sigma factor for flagellar operon FliA